MNTAKSPDQTGPYYTRYHSACFTNQLDSGHDFITELGTFPMSYHFARRNRFPVSGLAASFSIQRFSCWNKSHQYDNICSPKPWIAFTYAFTPSLTSLIICCMIEHKLTWGIDSPPEQHKTETARPLLQLHDSSVGITIALLPALHTCNSVRPIEVAAMAKPQIVIAVFVCFVRKCGVVTACVTTPATVPAY